MAAVAVAAAEVTPLEEGPGAAAAAVERECFFFLDVHPPVFDSLALYSGGQGQHVMPKKRAISQVLGRQEGG
jgi:hypothetical protein